MATLTVRDLLIDTGLELSVDDVVDVCRQAARRPHDLTASPLPVDQEALLRAHSGLDRAHQGVLDGWLDDPELGRTTLTRVDLELGLRDLQASLTPGELASLRGVHKSAISRAITERRVYAISLGRARRLPRWQFRVDGTSLPGLERVVRAIPDGVHPASIAALMETPQESLDGMPPIAWLDGGGDPARVAALLDDLVRW